MLTDARAQLTGVVAALLVPLCLGGRRLQRLLASPTPVARAGGEPDAALHAAHRTVRQLAQLPGSPWRATCLYHSAAACLVLRRYGVPARLRLGVRGVGSPARFTAHAWVETPDPQRPGPPEYTTFSPPPALRR